MRHIRNNCSPTRGQPRSLSPFNVQTDYDLLFDLPLDIEWHRFEARVGIADWASGSWQPGFSARFLLIDDEAQCSLWESTDSLEPWAPTELCSVLLDTLEHLGEMPVRRLCLRVQCGVPPTGAMWIEPTITVLKPGFGTGSRVLPALTDAGSAEDNDSEEEGLCGVASSVVSSWYELFVGVLTCEIASSLQCKDLARLMCARCFGAATQQNMWHFTFASNFHVGYARYFLHPLRGQTQPPPEVVQAATTQSTGPSGRSGGGSGGRGRHSGHTLLPSGRSSPSRTPGRANREPSRAPPSPPPATPGVGHTGVASSRPRGFVSPSPMRPQPAVDNTRFQSTTSKVQAAGSFVPVWALEFFDWRQICKRFHLSQLLCVSVNFQVFNGMTPAGFVKDSGEPLHASPGAHGQGHSLRYGWNIHYGADHFLSCPSAVVAHRSPLGVAGVPSSVATVRGTAGPEPLAMTPMVSEKDSCVVLEQSSSQVRPQWSLEVDAGHYIVVATVGDRNVGFWANLEVGGHPLFSNDWVEPGSFKSRCMQCVVVHGRITVGSCARIKNVGRDREELPCSDTVPSEHEMSPRGASPWPRSDFLSRGTRLVSVRIVSVPLAREVERERSHMVSELNQKISESRARVDSVRQAQTVQTTPLATPVSIDPSSTDPRGATILDREYSRAQSKLAELHVQKALKLFAIVAMCRHGWLHAPRKLISEVDHRRTAEQVAEPHSENSVFPVSESVDGAALSS